MAQKLETRYEKKPLFCLKFSPKNLYFTKNSLYKKPLFSNEPARGADGFQNNFPQLLSSRSRSSLQNICLGRLKVTL